LERNCGLLDEFLTIEPAFFSVSASPGLICCGSNSCDWDSCSFTNIGSLAGSEIGVCGRGGDESVGDSTEIESQPEASFPLVSWVSVMGGGLSSPASLDVREDIDSGRTDLILEPTAIGETDRRLRGTFRLEPADSDSQLVLLLVLECLLRASNGDSDETDD
jgi:hypothetical protein